MKAKLLEKLEDIKKDISKYKNALKIGNAFLYFTRKNIPLLLPITTEDMNNNFQKVLKKLPKKERDALNEYMNKHEKLTKYLLTHAFFIPTFATIQAIESSSFVLNKEVLISHLFSKRRKNRKKTKIYKENELFSLKTLYGSYDQFFRMAVNAINEKDIHPLSVIGDAIELMEEYAVEKVVEPFPTPEEFITITFGLLQGMKDWKERQIQNALLLQKRYVEQAVFEENHPEKISSEGNPIGFMRGREQ